MKVSKALTWKLGRLISNQSELSRMTGVSQSAISEASAGKRRLYADQAFLIARAIGVSLDYLMDDEQDEPPEGLSEDAKYILRVFRDSGLTASEAARRIIGKKLDVEPLPPEEEEPPKRKRGAG